MERIKLNRGWKVTGLEPNTGDIHAMSKPGFDTSTWYDMSIPGDVNATLIKEGKMPDPNFGDSAKECYWVTSKEWWYRIEFSFDADGDFKQTDLYLDGIDGHVDLYLNEQKLSRLENAFRPYRINVTDILRKDSNNVLLMRFQSIDEIMGGSRKHELGGWYNNRVLMRKPQFSFGWDWSLPLPSIGILGPAKLECHTGARILDASVKTFISGRLDFKFQVTRAARDAGYYLIVRVYGHGIDIKKKVERAERVFSYTSLYINGPKLWWPNGMGEQALYNYEIELVIDGRVVDKRIGRFGIRESSIIEEPFTEEAGPGISFWIQINGKRVFCKGANWVPPEIWPAIVDDEQYRFYLKKTVHTNFNILRVWGGGMYERDIFYELCDELGIMVWQDFMFASTGYPVDLLRHEIIAEAEYQVKRLRDHPSIVLWCGCNEDVYSWSLPNEKAITMADTGVYNQEPDIQSIDRFRDDPQIYSMILRGTVSRLGLGVPYIESSPQSYEDAGNMPQSGNSHISCWKYCLHKGRKPEDFRKHFDDVCSFDSEFCIQGPCDLWTFEKFLPEEHRWPPDDMWTYHIQRGHYNLPHHEQTLSIAGAIFGEIDSLQKYVKYGQATHIEMMRAEFESARRDRPNNGGTMVWMLNDCWPTSNWSIIDYYRRPKPAYYSAKRACADHLPIIFQRHNRIEFFFSNDSIDPCQVDVIYGQEHLDGSLVWNKRQSLKVDNCDTRRFHMIEKDMLDRKNDDYLFIDAIVNGQALPRVTYFPDMWKHIEWPIPDIQVEILQVEVEDDGYLTTLKLTTDVYARFCHIIIPDKFRPFWINDNFFNLCAKHSHIINVWSLEKIDINKITVGHWLTDWQ